MKLAIKLAIRNLLGAGIRTWLNVVVLSFSFIIIIWIKGVMVGWDHQSKTDMKNWEIGNGQYWISTYDPYDPFTLTDSHGAVPPEFADEIAKGEMEPFLISQATIYPQGRIQPIRLKGINPQQKIFLLPSHKLDTTVSDAIPAFIGTNMAKNTGLKKGDRITLQWRDKNGAFDAAEILITEIFSVSVPAVDAGQIYIPLEKLQSMLGLPGEATLLTYSDPDIIRTDVSGWTHKSFKELTVQVDEMIKMKSTGQSVLYMVLLLLAMLAIFDTQVLSIFRRQKEIGTYIALGYTRQQVVGLFTVEGTMYAVFAALLSAVIRDYPFLPGRQKQDGQCRWIPVILVWQLPRHSTRYYTAGLVISTVILVTLTTCC